VWECCESAVKNEVKIMRNLRRTRYTNDSPPTENFCGTPTNTVDSGLRGFGASDEDRLQTLSYLHITTTCTNNAVKHRHHQLFLRLVRRLVRPSIRTSALWLAMLFVVSTAASLVVISVAQTEVRSQPAKQPSKQATKQAPQQTTKQSSQQPTSQSCEGRWAGALVLPNAQLPLVLNIKRSTEGASSVLRATLDSPLQGAFGIAASTTTFTGTILRVEFTSPQASYEATFEPAPAKSDTSDKSSSVARDSLRGVWRQGAGSLPLVFGRAAADSSNTPSASQSNNNSRPRPQQPKAPFPYTSEEVRYASAEAGVSLAGTLTLPRVVATTPVSPAASAASNQAPKRFPAVVLITGSGQQDRDETIAGHKPFWVIADALTRQGIAVLRSDDRGVGGSSTGDLANASTKNFAEDVRGAVAFLASRSDIDPARIALVGHSEGGIIAPMVAADPSTKPAVAGCVLLAGTGLNGGEVTVMQVEAGLRASGANDTTVKANVALQREIVAVVRDYGEPNSSNTTKNSANSGTHNALIRSRIAAIMERAAQQGLAAPANTPAAAAARKAQTDALLSNWIRTFWNYDPQPALRATRCPVLALNGSHDVQVPPVNLQHIAAALKQGGNSAVTTKELPRLNHLFQTSSTGAVSEYEMIEETFAPAALEALTSWLVATLRVR
jgi:uncharacterized protein